jgi:hypothetical protein
MKKDFIIAALAFAVLFALLFKPAPAPSMRMGQPMYDKASGRYICELTFGSDGYASIEFRSTDAAIAFSRLSGVEVVMRAAPIRTARSEVVVEASK